jgi:hypothetical protein
MLERNDRRASEAVISGTNVMVHMRITGDDLSEMLKSLEKQFPEGTKITTNPPYSAWMSSETKRKYKAFIAPALAGYVATVIGVFMLNYNNLSTRVLLEAFLSSVFPAAAAIALKIFEKYS